MPDDGSGGRDGFTVIELLAVAFVISVLMSLIVPAVQRARASASLLQCSNQLRQIGIACQNFEATYGVLPSGKDGPHTSTSRQERSWLVQILPYLDQGNLFLESEAAFEEMPFPYLSPPHFPLQKSVSVYSCPADSRMGAPVHSTAFGGDVGLTSYLGVCGLDHLNKSGVLVYDDRIRLRDVTDGLSNTLLCGERPPSADGNLGWWYTGVGQDGLGNGEMFLGVAEQLSSYSGNRVRNEYQCPSTVYAFGRGRLDNPCDVLHFWSLHDSGAMFALSDGSVRFLAYESRGVVELMATRNGGGIVPDL